MPHCVNDITFPLCILASANGHVPFVKHQVISEALLEEMMTLAEPFSPQTNNKLHRSNTLWVVIIRTETNKIGDMTNKGSEVSILSMN
jgi:hypothetical protein